MRTILTTMTCLLMATLTFGQLALAEDTVDIAAVAGAISDRDPGAIVAILHDPMANEALPAPFSDAMFVDPSQAASASVGLENAGMEEVMGTVTYTMTYSPAGPATPSVQASPQASGPEQIYSRAAVHYLVFDHELNAESLNTFDEIFRTTVGDQAADAEIEEISVQDSTAYRISIETQTNGIPIVMEWLAIPVGSVAVISMAMTGGESVDIETVQSDSESLALAGIGHLGSAAENESAPAG